VRKKMTVAERLARRPGPRKRAASTAIPKLSQAVDPQIGGELNRGLTVSPPARRGAPRGNQNRLVHGKYSAKRRAFMAVVRAHIRSSNWLVRQVWAARPVTKSGRRVPPTVHLVERIGR
jgi:hypothetical protein